MPNRLQVSCQSLLRRSEGVASLFCIMSKFRAKAAFHLKLRILGKPFVSMGPALGAVVRVYSEVASETRSYRRRYYSMSGVASRIHAF